MFNMVPYKPKVMNVEYDILNLSPIIQNINAYPKEDNNCSDELSMVLLYGGKLCDTIVYENTDLIRNNVLESIYLVLSRLHIGDAKYRI